MVVTCAPATALSGVMQDRTARRPRCTVQAPHWPMPQPNLVPVSPATSRMAQSKGVSGLAVTLSALPLSWKIVVVGVMV